MTNYEKYRALRAAVERVLHYLASPVHILGISPNDQRVEAIRMLNAAFAATPAEPESCPRCAQLEDERDRAIIAKTHAEDNGYRRGLQKAANNLSKEPVVPVRVVVAILDSGLEPVSVLIELGKALAPYRAPEPPAPDADTFDAFDKPLHPERYEDTPPAPAPVTPDVAKILEVRCDDDLPDDVIELHYGPHTVARITLRPEPTTVEPTPADPPPPLTDEDAKRCAAIHTDEGDIYLIPDDILQKLRTKLRKSQCSAFQIVDWFFDCNKMKSNLAEAIVGMHDEEIRAWAQEKEAHDVK